MDLTRILCPVPPVLTFKNPCGRAGCDHVFEYAGTNPFQQLATLVATHAPHSVSSATVRCETEWQPSEKVFEAILTDDMYHNFGGFATQVIQDRKYNEAPQPTQRPSYDESDTEDDVSDDSVSSWGGRKKKARTSKPRSAVNLNFATIALGAPTHKKKGARTEAQRRAHLEGDVWTTKVAPHYVGCRGCKQIIRLDRRSRYYPGLFTRPADWTGFLTHYGWHSRIISASPRKSMSRLLSKRVHRSIRWSWPHANPRIRLPRP